MRSLVRGLAAGAVGTTVLNAVTYLDMALTGRPASAAPADTVLALADSAGLDLTTRGSRPEAYGALAGLGVGVGVGGVAGLVRSLGIRLPLLAEAAVIGAGAMAATDGPMALADVTDLTTWTSTDWVRDVLPHLAYGAAVAGTLRGLEPARPPAPTAESETRRPRVVARSLAIGLAAGARSTLGLVPPALAIGPRSAVASASLVTTELVLDKLPFTPSRIAPGPALGRIGTGALGAAVLARHEQGSTLVAVGAGALGAVAGTLAGALWREIAADRGWTWQAAAAEDAAALALTAYAWRG